MFNLYYHKELTDEEFNEHHSGGRGLLNVVAVNDEMFGQIAEAAVVMKKSPGCGVSGYRGAGRRSFNGKLESRRHGCGKISVLSN